MLQHRKNLEENFLWRTNQWSFFWNTQGFDVLLIFGHNVRVRI